MTMTTQVFSKVARAGSLVAALIFAPRIAEAVQSTPNNPPSPVETPGSMGLVNPLKNIDSLPEFLNAILDAVIQIGTIVLILALVYVGFKFVAARGNAEEIQSARSALVWTVIGGLILLGAKAIGLVIEGTVSGL